MSGRCSDFLNIGQLFSAVAQIKLPSCVEAWWKRGLSFPTPPLPPEVWDRVPSEAQALILAIQVEIASFRAEVADLKARLDENSNKFHKPRPEFPSCQSPRPAGRGAANLSHEGHPNCRRWSASMNGAKLPGACHPTTDRTATPNCR